VAMNYLSVGLQFTENSIENQAIFSDAMNIGGTGFTFFLTGRGIFCIFTVTI